MKQIIQMGNNVDDGRGDYLRIGAKKINENTEEVFGKLGDGSTVFPAGAWKIHDSKDGRTLTPNWGDAYSINTMSNDVVVNLPKGTGADYGKAIKLRDVWSSWAQRNVTIQAATGNTVKGKASDKLFRDLQDVELVFCSPGRWEYVDNKFVSKISSSNIATVSKKDFVASQGQVDFLNVFGDASFNARTLEVYHKGNMLWHGDKFTSESDYGSPGPNGTIVPLDGKSIRLRFPCDAGDIVAIKTYTDDLAVYRSSYTSRTIRVYDLVTNTEEVEGEIVVADLLTKKEFDFFDDFGFTESDGQFNPMATEVLINGRQLTKSGTAGLDTEFCKSDPNADEESCPVGDWVATGIDFSLVQNSEGAYRIVRIEEPLESGDVLTVRWFNNDIGTTLSWEEIEERADARYLVTAQDNPIIIKNRIVYTDPAKINPCTVVVDPIEEQLMSISSLQQMFDIVHPVGSIYENGHNRANPRDYMGLGTWVPWAEGKTTVGWTHDNDVNFGKYVGECGELSAPGASGGSVDVQLTKENVPVLESKEKVLIADPNGDILVGQCQVDPEGEGPGYFKYREDELQVNVDSQSPIPVNNLQPYVTSAKWLRIA
ncbi:MAG: hypothetical protein [Caudoviricetes sp.]|nr:MAG: hypothetical protein [Caudoviricetes sp.]